MRLKAWGVLPCGAGTGGNSCILTAHWCGLLPQVVEGTVCAGNRSSADQFVSVWVGRHLEEKVAEEVGYEDGKTTQQGDVILDLVYPGSMQPAPRCVTENGIGISDHPVAM